MGRVVSGLTTSAVPVVVGDGAGQQTILPWLNSSGAEC